MLLDHLSYNLPAGIFCPSLWLGSKEFPIILPQNGYFAACRLHLALFGQQQQQKESGGGGGSNGGRGRGSVCVWERACHNRPSFHVAPWENQSYSLALCCQFLKLTSLCSRWEIRSCLGSWPVPTNTGNQKSIIFPLFFNFCTLFFLLSFFVFFILHISSC